MTFCLNLPHHTVALMINDSLKYPHFSDKSKKQKSVRAKNAINKKDSQLSFSSKIEMPKVGLAWNLSRC